MAATDANLLLALDALLREGSVVRAARRMNLSPTAMSHTLARLRAATGDALFVRAGQRLVPTSRALALQKRVETAAEEVRSLLRPDPPLELRSLDRTFTVRANDDMAITLGRALDAAICKEAPNVRLTIVFGGPEHGEDESLRSGTVDLDIGVVKSTGPELRVQLLYRDSLVIVVREGHPLARRRLTGRAFALAKGHISCSRQGLPTRLEKGLKALGLECEVERVVPTFVAGAWLAAESDRIVMIPSRLAAQMAPALRLRILTPPFPVERVPVYQSWHPRLDGDAAHAWLRQTVRRVCAGDKRRMKSKIKNDQK